MPLPDAIPAGVATAGLGLLFSMVVPTFVVIRSVDLYSERQRARSAPEEIVFSGLRYAISRLSDGASFHHREFRSQIARRIHESATILELRGSAMVSVGDAGRVRTVETRMKEAAAVLHSYEVWLALPEFATRDVLLQELSRFIVTFCGGHFGELPRATLPPTPSHPSQAAVGRTVRTLITALMPAALLFLFTQLGLHPLAPMWNVMIAGSLLWAIVNLMALLDPGYTTKIATIKDLASIAQTFLRSAGKDSTGEDHSE
jgi:hypothetical protein